MAAKWYIVTKKDGTWEGTQGRDRKAVAKLYGVSLSDVVQTHRKDIHKKMKSKGVMSYAVGSGKDFIPEDIINKIDYLIPEKIEWKKVVRQGKVIKKLICPPGFKAKGGKCVRMSPKELMHRKISSKKAQKKLRLDKGKIVKLERKKAKSLKKRAMITPAHASKPGGQSKES